MSVRDLLAVQGEARAADSKTVRLHAFDVPPDTDALALHFEFAPRQSTDRSLNDPLVDQAVAEHLRTSCTRNRQARAEALRSTVEGFRRAIPNLLNVVLVDPRGDWRGRWDQNPSSREEELVLGREEASHGFLPGNLAPGRWVAAVEVHGVFGAPVHYELRVRTDAGIGRARKPTPGRTSTIVAAGGWLVGEMHSHTRHSDGRYELEELVAAAQRLGMDFLCLTDHNTTSGLRERAGMRIPVVAGCEWTTFHGHHPVYGPQTIVPWHVEGQVRRIEDVSGAIRDAGGLASLAHPFRIGDPLCTGCRMRGDLDLSCLDMMEVWYRRWDASETDNEAAYSLWNEAWRRGLRITAVGARDWHGKDHELPLPGPVPLTAVRASARTEEAILDALRRGEVMVTGGPMADVRLVGRRESAGIGGTLREEAGATMVVSVERAEKGAELRILHNGECIRTVASDRDAAFEFEAAEPGWYRAEIWKEGLPRLLTNHVVRERSR